MTTVTKNMSHDLET